MYSKNNITCVLQAGFLFGLVFIAEDGGERTFNGLHGAIPKKSDLSSTVTN